MSQTLQLIDCEADELTAYIFKNYFGLLTIHEKRAWKNCTVELKVGGSANEEYKAAIRARHVDLDPQTQALLENGQECFLANVRDRVMKEHADQIVLKRCPKCAALCRTPEAKLCPKCHYNWRRLSE